MAVQISIVQKQPDQQHHQTIYAIRKSSVERDGPRGTVTIDGAAREPREALAEFRRRLERGGGIDFGILVLLGFTAGEIENLRADGEEAQIEIICPRLGWDYGDGGGPLADLNTTLSFGDETHIGEAVRKSWLRGRLRKQGVRIRPIRADEPEVEAYLVLRYQVYQAENYIPPEHNSVATRLEVNFSDRWSFPMGAFSKEGRLMGCVRLVEEYGQDNEYKSVIERIILARRDAALNRAWELRELPYPFDLCQHFDPDQFAKYYRALVQGNVSKAEISRVIVLPEHRGLGLGEVLVDTMISRVREQRNTDLLFLACKEVHRSLYERSGFRRIPDLVCEHFGQYGVRAIAMERRLAGGGAKS